MDGVVAWYSYTVGQTYWLDLTHCSNLFFCLAAGCVHTQGNMAMFQTWVLFLELQPKESTLNEQDRCCSSALMVVFQCAAERSLHGSFVKRPASACCQAPLVLLITHDKVMVKWGQLARAETAWTEGEGWICVHVSIWNFPTCGFTRQSKQG